MFDLTSAGTEDCLVNFFFFETLLHFKVFYAINSQLQCTFDSKLRVYIEFHIMIVNESLKNICFDAYFALRKKIKMWKMCGQTYDNRDF